MNFVTNIVVEPHGLYTRFFLRGIMIKLKSDELHAQLIEKLIERCTMACGSHKCANNGDVM